MVFMIPTKPSNVTWTDDQWKAIYAKGQDILVAAAAGSGKTAVLIERLIQKILAPVEERIDVDALLVVTFTNASAAEMRNRMAAALEKAVENSTDKEQTQFLRRQLSLIGKAQISTLHSFCLAICRQYAYMIDLDPGFRIASQDEVALLKDDVLAEVLEKAYKGEADGLPLEAVYMLVDSFTSDRNDTQIESLVEKLYEMARVQPKPFEWLAQLPQQYDLPPDITVDELSFIDELKMAIEHQLLEAKYHYDEMTKLANADNGLEAYLPVAQEEGALIAGALSSIQTGTWQQTADVLNNIKFGRIPTVKKGTFDEAAKANATGHRDASKDIVKSLKETYFTREGHYLVEEIRKMKPIIESLVKLTVLFSEAFKAAKLERSIIDFSDLEHYALEILTVPDEDELKPSPVALDYQKRFKEVLVDEYQDTNLLQETILQLVKSGDAANGNMFMVGDVKQSIYQFRLAEPRLFLQKYKDFQEEPQNTGMKIDLNRNFRSRSEVLASTNYIFEQVMDENVGEINYDDQASLKYGEGYNEDTRKLETELVIFDEQGANSDDDEDAEVFEKSQREARYIIKRIKEMVGKEQVYDAKTKSYREVRYSDIVILMRSMRWSSDLAEEFKREKIPLYADSSKGYFEAIEVMIMMNLLKIIDNPYQDIPLASVLRSPFVGLTENELAEIRLANPRASFYEAMQSYLQDLNPAQEETRRKVQQFSEQLSEWRDFSRRGSLADLIWGIYLKTNYFEMVGAMANGKQRQANLRALHDRAIVYEKSSFRGLFRFLRFIDRMRSRGDDLGVAKSIGEGEDVVRLVTIHSSKGLEYPIVFVAGINGKFNMMDFRGSYMFDQDFGIAVKAIDPEHRIVATSLPYLALKQKKIAKMKAEEMRILYVAMTRAKEKLILVGAVSNWEKTKEKWEQYQNLEARAKLPDYVRANARSYLDWIGPAVARHQDFLTLSYKDEDPQAEVLTKSVWKVKILTDTVIAGEELQIDEEQQLVRADVNEQLVSKLTSRFTTSYPYEEAVKAKSKTSVSEIKRMEALEHADQETIMNAQLLKKTFRASSVMQRPAFMQSHSMTGAEIGTVVHAVMQHAPQQGFMSTDAVSVFLQQLVAKQILRKHEAEVIDENDIIRFFDSPIGQRFKNAKTLLREVPFTLRRTNELGIPQIMQGVIDCIFEDDNGQWVLLDYKTDKIRPPFHKGEALLDEMSKRYSLQLTLYAEALQTIKHIEIDEKVLYLYDIGEAIELP